MKKTYYLWGMATLALAATLTIPAFIRAQTLLETEGATGVGASIDNGLDTPGAGSVVNSIRNRIQADIKAQNANVKNNQDIRNTNVRPEDGHFASTTMGRLNPDTDGSVTKNMLRVRKDIFDHQKNRLITELDQALANLAQIRDRVAGRIQQEKTAGHDIAAATKLLAAADLKLAAARTAVSALSALIPQTSTTTPLTASSTVATSTATTTGNIDLGKPRQMGASAIQAVNNAKKALNAVVVAIAHSMGFKVDKGGNIIATSTATTTP